MRKLNGYRPTHRNKWLFIKEDILNVQELALLEFYADIFDFDKKHKTFGLFEVDFTKFKQMFCCKSENTIRNWHNKLLKLGFIKKTGKKHIYFLSCPERYTTPGKWEGKAGYYQGLEKDQPVDVVLQNIGVNFQTIGNKLQPIVENIEDLPEKAQLPTISSYKDDSIGFNKKSNEEIVIIEQEPRSENEYEKIKEEGNYKYMITDYMRWTDKHVKEKIIVENGEKTKEIIDVFFDGDEEKYKQCLITK